MAAMERIGGARQASRVAAIIPAFNEAARIGAVLAAVRSCARIDEILVVDDGSTDATAVAVQAAGELDPRLRLLQLGVNQGKGEAVMAGLEATAADIILLLDADLISLQGSQLDELLEPVVSGRVDMSVGQFRGGSANTDLGHRLAPDLSGQRAVRADLLRQVNWPAARGYGLETALTLTARAAGAAVLRVPLWGVTHPTCELHRGCLLGLATRVRMYWEVWRAWQLTRRSLTLREPHLRPSAGAFPTPCEPFDLATFRRVLVVAPHPDDEVLSAAGLIQGALAGEPRSRWWW